MNAKNQKRGAWDQAGSNQAGWEKKFNSQCEAPPACAQPALMQNCDLGYLWAEPGCLGRATSGANSDGREFAVGALAVRWATGFRRVIDENSYL
jgi:hypothetical protein